MRNFSLLSSLSIADFRGTLLSFGKDCLITALLGLITCSSLVVTFILRKSQQNLDVLVCRSYASILARSFILYAKIDIR